MRPEISRLAGKISDAELTLEAWPDVLESLIGELGAAGAA
jgi:hypothetical protein